MRETFFLGTAIGFSSQQKRAGNSAQGHTQDTRTRDRCTRHRCTVDGRTVDGRTVRPTTAAPAGKPPGLIATIGAPDQRILPCWEAQDGPRDLVHAHREPAPHAAVPAHERVRRSKVRAPRTWDMDDPPGADGLGGPSGAPVVRRAGLRLGCDWVATGLGGTSRRGRVVRAGRLCSPARPSFATAGCPQGAACRAPADRPGARRDWAERRQAAKPRAR